MKTQLRTIILAIPALSKVSAGDLSLHLAYRLKKSMNEFQKEADFFSEQRTKIFEKYGSAGEDGKYHYALVRADGGDISALVKDLNRALNGRGGGRTGFAQGSVQANKAEIEAFFKH